MKPTMSHILSEVENGVELRVTEIVSEGIYDISVGDRFEIEGVREKADLPDGSTPMCKWIADADHSLPRLLTSAQLKSANDDYSQVIIPNCQGGCRVRVEQI